MLEGAVVFASAWWIVAEIEVGRFADVLAHVVSSLCAGGDELAIDVVGIPGDALPGGAELGPIDEGGGGEDVKVRVPLGVISDAIAGGDGASRVKGDLDNGVACGDGGAPELALA